MYVTVMFTFGRHSIQLIPFKFARDIKASFNKQIRIYTVQNAQEYATRDSLQY